MLEQASFFSDIPVKRYPGMAAIASLRAHKRYRKGMEYEEAASVLKHIAGAYEPRGPLNLVQAMAKFKKEKREREEGLNQI